MKEQSNTPGNQPIDLKMLNFSAKIDYITIYTPRKVKLPAISGRQIWPRKYYGERLTVHDATSGDIDVLIGAFGAARICELEIAIDVRANKHVPASDCEGLLQAVMVNIFARGLEPSRGQGMPKGFRAFYRRLDQGYMVRPFNRGLPRATDQLLHGGRQDAVQVKGYWKRRDQGVTLQSHEQVARVEVRLGSEGMFGLGLTSLTDLGDFRFRKNLMPYFSHVQGTTRVIRGRNGKPNQILDLLLAKQHEFDDAHWNKVGVGAFLKGGNREHGSVRFTRNTPVNNRIGQALTRMERQFRKTKFPPLTQSGMDGYLKVARPCAVLEKSSVAVF